MSYNRWTPWNTWEPRVTARWNPERNRIGVTWTGYSPRITDVLKNELPRHARFWKPEPGTKSGVWWVNPTYSTELRILLRRLPVSVDWRVPEDISTPAA